MKISLRQYHMMRMLCNLGLIEMWAAEEYDSDGLVLVSIKVDPMLRFK